MTAGRTRNVTIKADAAELVAIVEVLRDSLNPSDLAEELARVNLDTCTAGTDEVRVVFEPTDRLRSLAAAVVARDGDSLAVE